MRPPDQPPGFLLGWDAETGQRRGEPEKRAHAAQFAALVAEKQRAAVAKMRAEFRAECDELFVRVDRDGDGQLTKSEIKKGLEARDLTTWTSKI